MEQFKHRNNARIVAYIDCFFTGLHVVALIILFVLAIWLSVSPNLFDENQLGTTYKGAHTFGSIIVIVLWIGVAVGAVIMLITLWATANLLKATKQGAEPIQSLQSIKIWKWTVIIFLALSLLGSLSAWTYVVVGLVQLAVRVTMICFVSKFNQELQYHVANEFERNQQKPYTTVVMN